MASYFLRSLTTPPAAVAIPFVNGFFRALWRDIFTHILAGSVVAVTPTAARRQLLAPGLIILVRPIAKPCEVSHGNGPHLQQHYSFPLPP